MTSYSIILQPEAITQLQELEDYIATSASPAIATRYVAAILDYCDSLRDFPHRGTRRDDIRPGLRTISYQARSLIAFTVGADRVDILGIFYGGQNREAALSD